MASSPSHETFKSLYQPYPRNDLDLESGTGRRHRRHKKSFSSFRRMLATLKHRLHHRTLSFFLFSITSLLLLLLFLSSLRPTLFSPTGSDGLMRPALPADASPFSELRNLIMVAGHSVYTGGDAASDGSWYLEPYQIGLGQAATFVRHIHEGVVMAARDNDALLLFSGGETRRSAGPLSEAQSYWRVAEEKKWFGQKESVRWRAVTEEHARDSFENLLFSVCRFHELTGRYPHNITVVGYDFKEERFSSIHRSSIRFPETRFFYSGTPVVPGSTVVAKKGEELVRAQFRVDPFGCSGSLNRKKLGRDPFRRSVPYPRGCHEIEGLFTYCGKTPYLGLLPW